MEVQDRSEPFQNTSPLHQDAWQDQTLHHPLSPLSVNPDEESFLSLNPQPIRNPLVAHQQYLSHTQEHQNRTRKPPIDHHMKYPYNVTHSNALSQDCSMSSHDSSSGYDSMTQSPPSAIRLHQRTIPKNHNIQQEQNYTTNYDNVRGQLRGPFVRYNNHEHT